MPNLHACKSAPKEFYKEMLDEKDFISERRRELKKKAGLAVKDSRVAWLNQPIT